MAHRGSDLSTRRTGRVREAAHGPVLALALAVAGCVAEAAPAADAPPPLRFWVFSPHPIHGLHFQPEPAASPQRIEFYSTAQSPRYTYRGAMPLRFLRADHTVAAEAHIPDGLADVLLLFLRRSPAGPVESPHQVLVLDRRTMRDDAGGLRILNLSGLELAGSVNGRALELRAGLNATIPPGSSVEIVLRAEFRGRTYQAYTNQFELGAGERALLLLLPPAYTGSLEVQSRLLRDEVESEQTAAKVPAEKPVSLPRIRDAPK